VGERLPEQRPVGEGEAQRALDAGFWGGDHGALHVKSGYLVCLADAVYPRPFSQVKPVDFAFT
jgi:hypothetical protein